MLNMTGILASILVPLADASVAIFLNRPSTPTTCWSRSRPRSLPPPLRAARHRSGRRLSGARRRSPGA
jgi:hypothetical protein